jgi:hypothetical protein
MIKMIVSSLGAILTCGSQNLIECAIHAFKVIGY